MTLRKSEQGNTSYINNMSMGDIVLFAQTSLRLKS